MANISECDVHQINEITNKFDLFYQNIIPIEEWINFKTILQEKLPTSFRLTSIKKISNEVLQILKKYDLLNHHEIECLKWYPNQLAWQINRSKKEIRDDIELSSLHKYLINETLVGSISRQESVSMIPPLLMDISSNHLILDMCASPGSKTAQLVEALYCNSTNPDGFVIANDMNLSRCYTLISQLKRINSPCLFITCQDSRSFPFLMKYNEVSDVSYLQFDRVLCDVPCSGDGTIRKSPNIYQKWNFKTAYDLHFMQVDILRRGLELLKEGGLLIYSTCSMNPVENEAVVFSILKQYKDKVKCIDCSNKLVGLNYIPGLKSWQFVNETQKCPKGSINCPSYEEYIEYGLNNCIRIHPHFNNTGGFFVALLRKVAEITNKNEDKMIKNTNKVFLSKNIKFKVSLKCHYNILNETNEEWNNIKLFYKLNNILPQNLVIRSESDAKNTIYYINNKMSQFLQLNHERVRIISCGSKMFSKSSFKSYEMLCKFRLVSDILINYNNFISSRLIKLNRQNLIKLLSNQDVLIEELESNEITFLNLSQGSIIFTISSNDIFDSIQEYNENIFMIAHKGVNRIRLMIKLFHRIHYLNLLGYDIVSAQQICQSIKDKQ